MRRIHIGVLLAALAALILTSIAVADENKPSASVAVSSHFTATGSVKAKGCSTGNSAGENNGSTASGNQGTPTTPNKVETRGQLAGTSTSSDKRLNGSVRVNLRILVNRSGFGIATGTFKIANKVDAELIAVVSSSNRLDGFLRGSAKDKRLFANFSATLSGSASGSTLTGDIGTGSHLNTAVSGLGGC
jgi:hypothetical protein